jgi:hypothetical protein
MIKKWIDLLIYKPNTKEIYWNKIVTIVASITVFFVFVHFDNIRIAKLRKERESFRRYTIGVTTAEHNNVKGSMVVEYDYYFAGSKYSHSNTTKNWLFDKPNTHGGRYYVVFASNHPTNVVMLFKYPVPEYIGEAPDSGWVNMPGFENEKVVE